MSLVAVIDFETTGLSPAMGYRATEVAIVLIQSGSALESLMRFVSADRRSGIKRSTHP